MSFFHFLFLLFFTSLSLFVFVTFFSIKLTLLYVFTLVCEFFSSKSTFLDKVLFYVLGLVKYHPMRASSYLPLPKELKAKQCCFNIENDDEKCFLWSILASLHPVQRRNDLDRVLKYWQYEHDFNMSGSQYPVDIKDINKFEHQNNISVNVYEYEDKKVFPLRITTMTAASHHVNLLYITVGKTSHYILLKDLSRLVSRQYNNYKNTVSANTVYMVVPVKRF